MDIHLLRRTSHFAKNHNKLVKKNQKLLWTIDEVLRQLSLNPFWVTLKTHKVNSPIYGVVYSSRVTGDIRIIWMYDKDNRLVLILLAIGSHDEVY